GAEPHLAVHATALAAMTGPLVTSSLSPPWSPQMKAIGKIFLTGMFTVLPILATVYLILWLFAFIERFLGRPLLFLLPDEAYRTGMGLVTGMVLIFLTGLLMRAWLFRQIVKGSEDLLMQVPL